MRNILDNGQGITIWEDPKRFKYDESRIHLATQEEMRRIHELDSEKKRKRDEEKMGKVRDRRYRGLKHAKRDADSSMAQSEH